MLLPAGSSTSPYPANTLDPINLYPLATLIETPLPYPPPDVTVAAIIAFKATGAAEMAITLAAHPTYTSTPTFPVGAPLCRASDLHLERSNGAGAQYMVIRLQITNTGSATCALQGPPDVILIDQAGIALGSNYIPECFDCDKLGSQATPIPSQTQTAIAESLLNDRIGIAPSEHVNVLLLWENWCKPLPSGGAKVRLILPAGLGVLESSPFFYSYSRCESVSLPSKLTISQYSH